MNRAGHDILPRAVSRAAATANADLIKEVNTRYHDAAAERYDCKWGIDYGEVGRRQVLMKLRKALGAEPGRFERALEVGAGTGYFSINLTQAGVIGSATATDISPGMLDRLAATAEELGLDVETVPADAEQLPFADGAFDLVLGHAVLHHLPSLDRALSEFHRVLRPGGTLVFMGEPSRHGDRLAALPKRLGHLVAPAWRTLLGVKESRNGGGRVDANDEDDDEKLESWVDVHTFGTGELELLATRAGFADIRVSGEELVASAYGWFLRALEADADPAGIPGAWHQSPSAPTWRCRGWTAACSSRGCPQSLFYNLLLSARKRRKKAVIFPRRK